MNGREMIILGYVLLGSGMLFFIVSQVILNRWSRSYDAEISRL